jgi:transcriptional regulator with XRE-family HTH domain
MIGDKLKALREAKSWSQGHLAEAAGLNIRTIQRIEAGEPPSDETMLCLAAAFDVDVSELEAVAHAGHPNGNPPGPKLWAAMLLISPAAVFLIVNLLRTLGLTDAPYAALARSGADVMSFQTFNLVSPVIFLGGPAVALLMSLSGLVRLRTAKANGGSLIINGLELRANRRAAMVAVVAAVSGATLFAYALLEAVGTHAG